jgi:hypothetical protein
LKELEQGTDVVGEREAQDHIEKEEKYLEGGIGAFLSDEDQ